jgi:hypothetical protein
MSAPSSRVSDAIRYDDVRASPIVLTAEQAVEVAKRAEALKKVLADPKINAKYKIELVFGKARGAVDKPTPGMVSFWLNGSKFHGGGDEKLYLCPGRNLKKNDCEAIMPAFSNTADGSICPACGNIWKSESTIGEYMFNLPMRKWAEVLHRFFRIFEYHSDIYLKYAPLDIRSITRAQAEKTTWEGSKKLANTRDKRAKSIYPLRNIIKDINAGADLEKRLYAFLVS